MHTQQIEKWQHKHQFQQNNPIGERRTYYVLALTIITMVVEIVAGSVYGSMALLADGWHMGTHAMAFIITIFAYYYARKHAQKNTFTFGSGKTNVLGGFASAILLGLVALIMMGESFYRLFSPQEIHFNEAIMVAIIGLTVNIISVFLLHDNQHNHDHHHDEHDHHHHHHDHNLKAAYLHVLADALTSLLAIVALFAGKYWGWNWVDAVMGIIGSIIIIRWAMTLIKQTSPILLDANIDKDYENKIVNKIESVDHNRVCDIHVWKVSANHYSMILSIVTHQPQPVAHYQQLLKEFDRIDHLTIEINQCQHRD